MEVYIEDNWYLVDSTAGKLYKDYDRKNWFLPKEYIAFSKSLSVIDTGATEQSHNLLQQVAFVNKEIDYVDPGYRTIDLRDPALKRKMKVEYENLNLEPVKRTEPKLNKSGNTFTIETEKKR